MHQWGGVAKSIDPTGKTPRLKGLEQFAASVLVSYPELYAVLTEKDNLRA
jgi:hypothetical protein